MPIKVNQMRISPRECKTAACAVRMKCAFCYYRPLWLLSRSKPSYEMSLV